MKEEKYNTSKHEWGKDASTRLAQKITPKEPVVKNKVKKLKSFKSYSESLDVPTPSVATLAKKYGVSTSEVESQVSKGTKVEMEHTTDKKVAREIALDHVGEKLDYYDRLKKVEESLGRDRAKGCKHEWKPITMDNGDRKFSMTERCPKCKTTRKINPETGRVQRR